MGDLVHLLQEYQTLLAAGERNLEGAERMRLAALGALFGTPSGSYERRKQARVGMGVPVRLWGDHGEAKGYLKDLGGGGFAVATRLKAAADDVLAIEFGAEGGRFLCKVAWTSERNGGMLVGLTVMAARPKAN